MKHFPLPHFPTPCRYCRYSQYRTLLRLCIGLAWLTSNPSPAQDAIVIAPETALAITAISSHSGSTYSELHIRFNQPLSDDVTHFTTTVPARIVIDLPASINRTGSRQGFFDARQAGTPVLLHDYVIAQTAERTRIVLNLKQPVEYSLHSGYDRLIIRMLPPRQQRVPAVPQNGSGGPDQGYRPAQQTDGHGEAISLNLHDVGIRELLQKFADFTGLNIVVSDSVNGKLTLRLNQVPWPRALDVILEARDLQMRQQDQVIWIAPRSELLNKEKNELQQRAQLAELEALHTEVFQLNYQKAEAFRKLLSLPAATGEASPPQLLSRRGSVMVEPRTNQLFVTDIRNVLDRVRKLLAQTDIPARQVEIEARIVEADDSFSRNLGVRLGLAAGSGDGRKLRGASDLPASPLNEFPVSNMALSLFGASASHLLNIELSALEANGKGQIISSPRVVTADQQAALIEQGEEIPYQQTAGNNSTTIAFKKANLKLEVTPHITPDGHVTLSVDISKDSRGVATQGGLAINTKHVKTQVQVEDGGTAMLGGIYTNTESDKLNKVPLLGDLPGLGYLFRNTEKVSNKTELLIFLTPRIVTNDNFVHSAQ